MSDGGPPSPVPEVCEPPRCVPPTGHSTVVGTVVVVVLIALVAVLVGAFQ